jgi:hypothetical protein
MSRILLVFAAGLALLSSACSHQRAGTRIAPKIPAHLAAEYQYPRKPMAGVSQKEMEANSHYTLREIRFPVSSFEGERELVLDYYDLNSPRKTPVILLLPILGGSYDVERHFANYFAKRGYAVVMVHREKKSKELARVDYLNAMLKQTVLDNRRAIDWIETQPDLDAQRVGVFGISMGGIKGALLTPLEPRVRASVLGLAGGDIPYIITHSTEKGIIKRRNQVLKEQNLTLEELHTRLSEGINCDPLVFAEYVDPARVLLVLASSDTVVPICRGKLLKEKMGNPETITISAGHYTAILYVPYIQREAFQFFERKFYPRKEGKGAALVQRDRVYDPAAEGLTSTP